MRRLCLIISVIPAAAAGFDVPAVDLNRGRFPSHPPSASQPGRRQRQQRLHTPLGRTHATHKHRLALRTHPNTHTNRGLFYLRGKVLVGFLCICCQCSHSSVCMFTNPPPPSPLLSQLSAGRCGTLNWQSIHQCVIYLMG